MLKKILNFLTASGLAIIMLSAEGNRVNAAADTNCLTQQRKCNYTGCDRLESTEAVAKCNSLWKFNQKYTACYEGCIIDYALGQKSPVEGCRFSECEKYDWRLDTVSDCVACVDLAEYDQALADCCKICVNMANMTQQQKETFHRRCEAVGVVR